MTDLLSQEEIDALLRSAGSSDAASVEATPVAPAAAEPPQSAGGAGAAAPPPPPPVAPPPAPPASPPPPSQPAGPEETLSQEAIDQLTEVAKLSLGATSSVVQMLLNRPIELVPSQLRVVSYSTLAGEGSTEDYVIAKIAYAEGFDGNSYLMIRKSISAIIGDLMMGGEGKSPEFQEMHKSAVGEMMNQMMGKTTTTLSELFKKRVDIAPPQVELVNFASGIPPLPDFHSNAHFLRIGFHLKIGDVAETEMVQLLPVKFAQVMAADLAKPQKAPEKAKPAPPPPAAGAAQPAAAAAPAAGPGSPPPAAMPGMPGMGGMPGMMPGM
ncbi:MAG TPA: chemotaxis protein CheC, partial [Candidatus Ozemobacteraceae bacterium]|nr:chemotaxis protein CheC [Candidatus Ozemobacteraceae bacterium]